MTNPADLKLQILDFGTGCDSLSQNAKQDNIYIIPNAINYCFIETFRFRTSRIDGCKEHS